MIAPPHIAKGEKLPDFIAIILVFLPAIGIGINAGRCIVEQQGLPIPIEPAVLIARGFVETLVETLHDVDDVAVECPEAELRHRIAQSLHLLHRLEEDFPLVPIANGICDVHDEDINTCIGQHGEVVENDIAVLAKEVAIFRFAPVIGGVRPVGVASRAHRVGLDEFRNIVGIRLSVMKIRRVPCDVEDTYGSRLVRLEGTLLRCRQSTPKGICSNPRGLRESKNAA